MHLPDRKHLRLVTTAAAAVMIASGIVYVMRTPPKPAAAGKGSPESLSAMVAPSTQETQNGEKPQASATTAAQPRSKITSYKVVEGDTVDAIAQKFGLKADTIMWANDITQSDILAIGQELSIPSTDGLVRKVAEGDTLWDYAVDNGADFDKIVHANPDISPEALQPGQYVVIPGGQPARRQVASRGSSESSEAPRRSSSTGFKVDLWPASGPQTDDFGWRVHPVYGTKHFHDGIDIGVPTGTSVHGAKAGTVTMAGWYGGYGIVVKIDHGGGLSTLYAHLSRTSVQVGQQVDAGQHIGYSGSTGASTGPHLHFSTYVNGSPVDPIGLLP